MQSLLSCARTFAPPPRERQSAFSPAVITDAVRDELSRSFFPSGAGGRMDLTARSLLPSRLIQEIRELFPERSDKDFFTLDDMMESVYDLVVTHCLRTDGIRQLGNANFRSMLCSACEAAHPLPPELQACVESDRRLLERGQGTIELLCTLETDKSRLRPSLPPHQGSDELVSASTPVHAVNETQLLALVQAAYGSGPLSLLAWDHHTTAFVNHLFSGLFAFEDVPSRLISRCRIQEASSVNSSAVAALEIYGDLWTHFGADGFTRDQVITELQFASSGGCVDYLVRPIGAYLRRKLNSLCQGIMAPVAPIPAPAPAGWPPFPAHVQPHARKDWPISFTTLEGARFELGFSQLDYGQSFARFLSAGEMPQLAIGSGKRERICTERNRCFFIHLGAALNIHPVWLQEYYRPAIRTLVLNNAFCSNIRAGLVQPLLSVLRHDALIEIEFLLSCWPEFLRGVRLLVVCVDGYLPDGREAIVPNTWTTITDPSCEVGSHREIVLKLSHSHFTLLQTTDRDVTHPVGHLLILSDNIGFQAPQEMGTLLLEPRNGVDDLVEAIEEVNLFQAIEDTE